MKMKQPHRVYLSGQAVELLTLLKALGSEPQGVGPAHRGAFGRAAGIGVDQRSVAEKTALLVSDYMTMGENGMHDMAGMRMSRQKTGSTLSPT